MPDWKNLMSKPAGAIPAGLITKIGILLTTVLLVGLILTIGLGGGGDAPANGGQGESDLPLVSRPVDNRLDDEIERQDRQKSITQAIADRTAERQRMEAAALALRNGGTLPGESLPTEGGDLPNPDETQLRRLIQLEELERRIRSLRASPVAHSVRDRNARPTGGGRDTTTRQAPDNPSAALALSMAEALASGNPSALLQALPGGTLPGGAFPTSGQLDIPLPSSSQLPDYANPPKLITPDDPAGWERVFEGSMLEAVLVTQLSGDFPGPVLAHVAVPFYSADRQRVLIPRGSRLIGTAQAVVGIDQERLAVAFHRLVLPDGRYVPLRFQGLNQVGESALRDQVNRHYWSTFFAAGAVGLLSGLTLQQGNPYAGGLEQAATGAGAGLGRSSTRVLDRFLNRLPTVTIRAGHRLRVWFTSDVLLPRPL